MADSKLRKRAPVIFELEGSDHPVATHFLDWVQGSPCLLKPLKLQSVQPLYPRLPEAYTAARLEIQLQSPLYC